MSRFATIRAVLFDVDGTLYDLKALKRRLVFRVPGELRAHGPRGFFRRIRSLQAFRRARERYRGQERVESLLETLVLQVAGKLGYEEELVRTAAMDFLYTSRFDELSTLSPRGDREVITELGERGYLLAGVSEYPVETKLRALGLAECGWGAMVDCEEVGLLKPAPAVFLEAARRLEVDPAECLVVGDRKDADVAGGKAAGMTTAWLAHRDPGHGPGPEPDVVLRGLGDLLELLPART